ncbi:MAG: PAAR-like domain-containing protein [Polyangiaceae bacterium]
MRGPGMNLAQLDWCRTPPIMIPVPYVNLGIHATALMWSPIVMFGKMNALTIGSFIPKTTLDEPGTGGGVASGINMGPGFFEMGSFVVFVEKKAAIRLTSKISGNNMNAYGVVVAPGIPTVLIAYDDVEETAADATSSALDVDRVCELIARFERAPSSRAELLEPGVGYFRVERFTADLTSAFFTAQARLRDAGAERFVLDLRGCPGGDVESAYRLAAEFLHAGALLGRVIDADGDSTDRVAPREGPYRFPLTLWVDGSTKSAAEAFVGALAAHARAEVVGPATFGKTTIQSLVETESGFTLQTRGRFETP